jgi:CDP-glucose 4,6-dehydratase
VRAGNVIGGGDWARDRLVPNTMRAVQEGKPVYVRDSRATRPWMHVLDALSGYLLVGQRLLESDEDCSKPWNFGPADENSVSVVDALKIMQKYWPEISIEMDLTPHAHEAVLLNLDCSQAIINLQWCPIWKTEQVFAKTARWYKHYLYDESIISDEQIDEYLIDALHEDLIWTR